MGSWDDRIKKDDWIRHSHKSGLYWLTIRPRGIRWKPRKPRCLSWWKSGKHWIPYSWHTLPCSSLAGKTIPMRKRIQKQWWQKTECILACKQWAFGGKWGGRLHHWPWPLQRPLDHSPPGPSWGVPQENRPRKRLNKLYVAARLLLRLRLSLLLSRIDSRGCF